MEETKNSQAQQPAELWTRFFEKQVELVSSLGAEMSKVQGKGAEATGAMMDELTALTHDTMSQATNVASMQRSVEMWKKLSDAQVTRMSAAFDVIDEIGPTATEHARSMMDEYVKISRTSLSNATKLSDAWRKVAVDAAREL